MYRILIFVVVCVGVGSSMPTNLLRGLKGGRCPQNVPLMTDFNVNRFMGTWYENERSDVVYGGDLKCGKSVMSRASETTINVVNSGTGLSDGQVKQKEGVATITDSNYPARMSLRTGRMPFSVDYMVLDTDYDNYALLYSCKGFGLFHFDIMWILSRDRSGISAGTRSQIYNQLTNLNMAVPRLVPQSQDGCRN